MSLTLFALHLLFFLSAWIATWETEKSEIIMSRFVIFFNVRIERNLLVLIIFYCSIRYPLFQKIHFPSSYCFPAPNKLSHMYSANFTRYLEGWCKYHIQTKHFLLQGLNWNNKSFYRQLICIGSSLVKMSN